MGKALRQNHVQFQQVPPTGTDCANPTPSAPALPVPNTMTAQHPNNKSRGSQKISLSSIQPNEQWTIASPSWLTISEDQLIQLQQPHAEPFQSSSQLARMA